MVTVLEKRGVSLLLPLLLLLLQLSTIIRTVEGAVGKICGSQYIRNHPNELRHLRNCSVIEGSLQIAMFEGNLTSSDYETADLSFPELREITGYFLVYSVPGLLSLRRLFPNLAVVRGEEFIHNHYSLLVSDCRSMQEVGLPSLVSLGKGRAWIYDNPNLCYLSTVDWTRISNSTTVNDFEKNKKNEQCPNKCPEACPMEQGSKWCWSNQDCQKVRTHVCTADCEESAGGCRNCCSDQCLGGCDGAGPEQCHVCKHVVYKGKCMSNCPDKTYKYFNRRCVTDQECNNTSIYDLPTHKYKKGILLEDASNLLGGPQCVLECPVNHVEEVKDGVRKCVSCEPNCKKICPGKVVDSLDAAKHLEGCTRINGSLKIQVRGYTGQLAKRLEESLGNIEEIDDYLAITNTYSLMSLDFFKSLKRINAYKLEEQQYALIVRSNDNLGGLWNKTVTIGNKTARVRFHYNPKLCPDKIREFVRTAGIQASSDERADIGVTNGDKVSCNQQELQLQVVERSSEYVKIRWENLRLVERTHLLSYEIAYREAVGGVNKYEERDPCGRDDAWKIIDAQKSDFRAPEPMWEEQRLLPGLKPFKRYAVYVKAVVIPDALNNNTGAESKLVYFTTLPGTPTKVEQLQLDANGTSEITVRWRIPESPNGELEEYRVYMWSSDDKGLKTQEFFEQRDYCHSGWSGRITTTTPAPVTIAPGVQKNAQCCSCDGKPVGPKDPNKVRKHTDVLYSVIDKVFFPYPDNHNGNASGDEESLVNVTTTTTTTTPSSKRRKRSPTESGMDTNGTSDEVNHIEFPIDAMVGTAMKRINEVTVNSNARLVTTVTVTNRTDGKMEVVLSNLTHFTNYKIGVVACRKRTNETQNDTNRCSEYIEEGAQTLPSDAADMVNTTTISANVTGPRVRFHWEEPVNPNGVVLAYYIKVRKTDGSYFDKICVTRKQLHSQKYNYTFPQSGQQLSPGNYSYSISTVSLAKTSNFTVEQHFVITAGESIWSAPVIALTVILPLLVLIALGFLLGFFYFRTKGGLGPFYTSANPYYCPNVDIDDVWEVPREKIIVYGEKELGKGSFGAVFEGMLVNWPLGSAKTKCAVKTVAENTPSSERARFLEEAALMSKMEVCHHVVRLLGVVSKTQPTYVIMELMAIGDLKKYLKSRRPDLAENSGKQPPSVKQILRMAAEIADGMAFLASHHLVHRDLAARNCMVAEDLHVKIGDFGMTKDVEDSNYYRKLTKGLLPIRWMAPESIDGVFTHQSDVWSYGVVLWEMATLAAQPYQGLSNEQVIMFVTDGNIMEKPENCPEVLYSLMKMCWARDPRNRLTFLEILDNIVGHLDPDFKYVSFYHSPKGIEHRTNQQVRPAQDELIGGKTPLRATCDSDSDLDDDHEFYDVEGDGLHDSENGTLLVNGGPRVMFATGGLGRPNSASSSGSRTNVNNNNRVNSHPGLSANPVSHVSVSLVNDEVLDNRNSVHSSDLSDNGSLYPNLRHTNRTSNSNRSHSPPSSIKVPPSYNGSSLSSNSGIIPLNNITSYSTTDSGLPGGGGASLKLSNGSTPVDLPSPTSAMNGNGGTNGYVIRRSPITDVVQAANNKTTQF